MRLLVRVPTGESRNELYVVNTRPRDELRQVRACRLTVASVGTALVWNGTPRWNIGNVCRPSSSLCRICATWSVEGSLGHP